MDIIVIDGSINEARQSAGCINTHSTDTHIHRQTTMFNTAVDFLHLWHRNTFDLVFIDIFLKGEASGVRVAGRIRKDDDQYTLIFTTDNTDFALKGHEVRTLDYMVKPLRYGKFSRVMGHFRSVPQRRCSHYIEIKESRIVVKLLTDDILYTGYSNRYIQIRLESKAVRTYMRLHDFSSPLLCYPQLICRYRNCIINMDKIFALEGTEFMLTTGERLPITRSLQSQVHQQYADYQFLKLNRSI